MIGTAILVIGLGLSVVFEPRRRSESLCRVALSHAAVELLLTAMVGWYVAVRGKLFTIELALPTLAVWMLLSAFRVLRVHR